ncbi:MAG TPA: DUF4440 domain-containing protein [Stellaceae bacterium]|nr:DUF4440 domain-containing protein [Stellaceae bacterium]
MPRSSCAVLAAALLLTLGIFSPALAAEKVRSAIDAGNRAFLEAYAKGDSAKVASLYATDAMVMPPGAPQAKGRAGIQKFWQGAMDAGIGNVTLKTIEVGSSGALAYEQGEFGLDVKGKDGKTAHVAGKYIVVWKRTAKGQWQLYRDIWNETPQ